MIEIDFVNSLIRIQWTEPEEENELQRRLGGEQCAFSFAGSWYVLATHVPELRAALATDADEQPFTIEMTKAFRTFLADWQKPDQLQLGEITLAVRPGITFVRGQIIPHDVIDSATSYFLRNAQRTESYNKFCFKCPNVIVIDAHASADDYPSGVQCGYAFEAPLAEAECPRCGFRNVSSERKWDGYIHLYRQRQRAFPSGLVFAVRQALLGAGHRVHLVWETDRPAKQFDWQFTPPFELTHDQQLAIAAWYCAGGGVIKSPTGFGKTSALAAAMIARCGVPTLFLANQISLIEQARGDFIDTLGVDVGFVGDGRFTLAPLTVATIQSVDAHLAQAEVLNALRRYFKLIIVDEVQAVGSDRWKRVFRYVNASMIGGMSATPRRRDGGKMEIHAICGPLVYDTDAQEQILKGRLSDVDIRMLPCDHGDPTVPRKTPVGLAPEEKKQFRDAEMARKPEYLPYYRDRIVHNETRNRIGVDKVIEMASQGRSVIALIQAIDHGLIIQAMLAAAGQPCEFIWGQTNTRVRADVQARFKAGALKVLVASTIMDTGMNLPIASGLVNFGAGGGQDDTRNPQRVGRVIRKFGLDKLALVYDFLDEHCWYFNNQAWNRRREYGKEYGSSRVRVLRGR